jgi:hypothetical protein
VCERGRQNHDFDLGLAEHLNPIKARMSDVLHGCVVDAHRGHQESADQGDRRASLSYTIDV